MKRSIVVQSHLEGDALVRALDIPALKTVGIITGLLLELPDEYLRGGVLQMVTQSLRLANAHEAREGSDGDRRMIDSMHEAQRSMTMAPAGSSGD